MNNNKEFKYEVDPNFDFVLEEHANTFISLRKIKWGDRTESKLDIRKYIATEEGERMMKGCSLSDEGADELTKIMIEEGYGKDNEIFNGIVDHRPEITSRFIDLVRHSSDEELDEHLSKFPAAQDDEDELYDLGDLLEG